MPVWWFIRVAADTYNARAHAKYMYCETSRNGICSRGLALSNQIYRKTSNISRTLVGNKIVDNSDVVGASPVGAAPTTSSFSTEHLVPMDWVKTTARGYKKRLSFGIWWDLY